MNPTYDTLMPWLLALLIGAALLIELLLVRSLAARREHDLVIEKKRGVHDNDPSTLWIVGYRRSFPFHERGWVEALAQRRFRKLAPVPESVMRSIALRSDLTPGMNLMTKTPDGRVLVISTGRRAVSRIPDGWTLSDEDRERQSEQEHRLFEQSNLTFCDCDFLVLMRRDEMKESEIWRPLAEPAGSRPPRSALLPFGEVGGRAKTG